MTLNGGGYPYTLNLLDMALTLYALNNGVPELNPLMRNVPIMIVYKTVIVGMLCWWLGKREEKIARYGLGFCTVFYGAVCVYHILNIAAVAA